MKNTTDDLRAVACIRFVRLAAPLAGRYCHFTTGEPVKVSTNGNGLATVERATWINSLTICNVLYGVPEHRVCEITEDEPNDEMRVPLHRLVRLRFAAFTECVHVEPTPDMPATATHATQSEHEGPWRFWSESNEHPVAIWQDDEMKSALREIAAKKTNPRDQRQRA